MMATIILTLSLVTEPAHADPKYAGIVVDAKTGRILYSDDPDGLRYPASLTKMMTMYLTFEAMEAHRIGPETKVPVSLHAASQAPTKLGVRPGGDVNVDQALRSLVTRSANDMAVALAELVGGSEDHFAQMMTAKARALGMTRTSYRNANGLPNTAQMTTARDQARLGMALRQHFPQYYSYFSVKSFTFRGHVIANHNHLVVNDDGVDGIKTGYTRAAGSNLATSVVKDGRSIVAIILGGRSAGWRDAKMRQLIATYMPKASRSGSGEMISMAPVSPVPTPSMPVTSQPRVAASTSDSRDATDIDLPNAGPTPARYAERPLATAYAEDSPSRKVAAQAIGSALVPANDIPMPSRAAKRPGSNERSDLGSEGVDDVTTASTREPVASQGSGWVIQIGASPSEKMATELLQDAQDKGGKVLRAAKPFTIAFNSNGGQMYRARFSGFEDQKSAVDACTTLKKKGMSCWASMQ